MEIVSPSFYQCFSLLPGLFLPPSLFLYPSVYLTPSTSVPPHPLSLSLSISLFTSVLTSLPSSLSLPSTHPFPPFPGRLRGPGGTRGPPRGSRVLRLGVLFTVIPSRIYECLLLYRLDQELCKPNSQWVRYFRSVFCIYCISLPLFVLAIEGISFTCVFKNVVHFVYHCILYMLIN